MICYTISGLGAGSQMFSKLHWPQEIKPVYLAWINPQENETLESYARRMLEKTEPNEAFIILGLSFGGLLALEMAKICRPQALILVSSLSPQSRLPWYYKAGMQLRLHRFLPASLLLNPGWFKNLLFGADSSASKILLAQTLRETDPQFLRWALDAVVNHKKEIVEVPVFHIHGLEDKILPCHLIHPHKALRGGHLMVFENATEVSEEIRAFLARAGLIKRE